MSVCACPDGAKGACACWAGGETSVCASSGGGGVAPAGGVNGVAGALIGGCALEAPSEGKAAAGCWKYVPQPRQYLADSSFSSLHEGQVIVFLGGAGGAGGGETVIRVPQEPQNLALSRLEALHVGQLFIHILLMISLFVVFRLNVWSSALRLCPALNRIAYCI